MSFLPGMFPAAVAARRRGGLTTLTKVAEATSTETTITGPAGIVAGDLLVLWDRALSAFPVPAEVVPSGFATLATANDGATTRCILSYKVATGAEASASLTGMNGNIGNDKVLIVIRGNIPVATVAPGSGAAQVTAGNPSAQVVTASAGTPPLAVVAGYAASAGQTVDPRTMSPAKDGEATSGSDCYLAWKIYDASPADVTADIDDEGTINALASGYLACA